MVKKVVKTTITEVKEDKPNKKKSTRKKTTKKKSTRKKATKKHAAKPRRTTTIIKPSSELISLTKRSFDNLEKRDALLIENFVGLQEAMANLSTKFSELSQNFQNILGVFELAAKTLAESEKQVDTTLSTKLDTLIEQNKSLSRELNYVDTKMRRGPAPQPMPQAKSSPPMYTRQMSQQQSASMNQPQSAIPPKEIPRI